MTSQTNAVVEMCEFILQFSEWNTEQKIFGSKNFLNDLTGRKFDDDFAFAEKTYNIAGSVYDFENGERREGSLSSAQSQRELNDYAKEVQEYVGKKAKSQAEEQNYNPNYQAENQAFAATVAENTNLKSALNCPDASNNPKYSEIYDKDIRPQEVKRNEAEQDRDFFKDRLYDLGKAMFAGESGLNEYLYAIDRFEITGVYQDITEDSYTEETYKPSQRKDKEGRPIPEKKLLKRKFQVFTAKTNQEPFTRFNERYSDKWKDYVKWTYLQKSTEFGVLAGADERVEKTFRNLAYECSERKLMAGYDSQKYDYDRVYDKKRQECEQSVQMNEKKANNLLEYYVNQYQAALFRWEDATSKIWTFESRYLKVTRVVTQKTGTNSFVKENVKCSSELSVAEMEKLGLKIEANNIKMREGVLKNKQKQRSMDETYMKQSADFLKEKEKKAAIAKQKQIDRQNEQSVQGSITPIRGGLRTGN